MSLSEQQFKDSIGTARAGNAEVLVYPAEIIGLSPCGCDGWGLVMANGLILSDYDNCVFPPHVYDGSDDISKRVAASQELAKQVVNIRREHCERIRE